MDFYTENLMRGMAIPISDLEGSDGSFKSLMEVSVRGGVEYLSLAETFLRVFQTVPERVLSYDTCQEYVQCSGNYRCRILVIEVDGDFVLTFLKVVDPIGKERRFTFHSPISLNLKQESVDRVTGALEKFSCIRDKVLSSMSPVDDFFTDEYFNDRESCKFMFTSKWRSSHGINKYRDLFEVCYDETPDVVSVDAIQELDRAWGESRFGKRIESYTLNYIKLKSRAPSIKLMTIRYRGFLVAFSILREQSSGMVRVGVAKSVSVMGIDAIKNWCHCDDGDALMIKNYLGSIFQYCLHQHYLSDLDFSAIFYTGWGGSKSLAAYKEKYYKKRLFFYRQELEVDKSG